MKILIPFAFFLSSFLGGWTQNDWKTDLIQADSSWKDEIFQFPLNFAPSIDFQGVEQAIFSPDWGKPDRPEFWTYAFAWNIEFTGDLTTAQIEENLQIYFNGLAEAVNKDTSAILPLAIAVFLAKPAEKAHSEFKGKIRIHDSFRTYGPLILQVEVEFHRCGQGKRAVVLFRFSPQEFEHEVWDTLRQVQLKADACD